MIKSCDIISLGVEYEGVMECTVATLMIFKMVLL